MRIAPSTDCSASRLCGGRRSITRDSTAAYRRLILGFTRASDEGLMNELHPRLADYPAAPVETLWTVRSRCTPPGAPDPRRARTSLRAVAGGARRVRAGVPARR